MRRFLIKTSAAAAVVIMAFALYILSVPMGRNNYLYMQNVKDSLMANVPSPRIILVSGSSTAFGVKSGMIRDSLHINVVNDGLNAALGMRFILSNACQYVREGDVMVIVAEYHHFFHQMEGSVATLGAGMYYTEFRKLHLLSAHQLLKAFAGIPIIVRENNTTLKHPDQDFYTVKGFNEYGDETGHYGREPVRKRLFWTLKIPEEKLNAGYVKCFNDLVLKIEAEGAKVICIPPPIAEGVVNDRRKLKMVEEALSDTGHPFIIESDRCILPDSLFWDSPLHLSEQGAETYTGILIEALKKELHQ